MKLYVVNLTILNIGNFRIDKSQVKPRTLALYLVLDQQLNYLTICVLVKYGYGCDDVLDIDLIADSDTHVKDSLICTKIPVEVTELSIPNKQVNWLLLLRLCLY